MNARGKRPAPYSRETQPASRGACQRCRKLRKKCIGDPCERCVAAGVECTVDKKEDVTGSEKVIAILERMEARTRGLEERLELQGEALRMLMEQRTVMRPTDWDPDYDRCMNQGALQFVVDKSGLVTFVSPQYAQALGYKPEEMERRMKLHEFSFNFQFHNVWDVMPRLTITLYPNGSSLVHTKKTIQRNIIRKDGTVFVDRAVFKNTINPDGSFTIVSFSDLTNIKETGKTCHQFQRHDFDFDKLADDMWRIIQWLRQRYPESYDKEVVIDCVSVLRQLREAFVKLETSAGMCAAAAAVAGGSVPAAAVAAAARSVLGGGDTHAAATSAGVGVSTTPTAPPPVAESSPVPPVEVVTSSSAAATAVAAGGSSSSATATAAAASSGEGLGLALPPFDDGLGFGGGASSLEMWDMLSAHMDGEL